MELHDAIIKQDEELRKQVKFWLWGVVCPVPVLHMLCGCPACTAVQMHWPFSAAWTFLDGMLPSLVSVHEAPMYTPALPA